MCKMNFCCSIATVFIILIAALVLTNSIDVHVTRKQYEKSEQHLKDFRAEAFKAKKDIEVLENFAEFIVAHGTRERRQAGDLFDGIDNVADKQHFEEEQIQPNCRPDICKARNCAGGVCRAESSKHSLHSSKELTNFLSNLKQESENMPREIFLAESEPNEKQNSAEVGGKSLSEEKRSEQKQAKLIDDRQKRLKLQKATKNDLRFRWPQRREQSKFHANNNIKKNSNFIKENQLDADISSCQQCSQNKPKDISNDDCKTHKASYESIKVPQHTKQGKGNFLNDFESQYSKADQAEAADGDADDEEDDDDDESSHIDSLKLSPARQQNDIKEYEFKQPALKINKEQENTALGLPPLALNDQLEATKNDLSHEADYKLSRDEQNASGNKKYASWKWGLFKRSHPFNAMNQIKLKTSQRLMKKGFGPSLPSYSLADNRRELFIENQLKQREKDIFDSDRRKYKHFEASNDIENNFRETPNQLEDLAEMPLEPEFTPLPRNAWSKTRYKRISDIKTRYKRELKVFNQQNLAKAFKYATLSDKPNLSFLPNSFENQNITAKAVRDKINGKLMDISKALNNKQKYSKAFANNVDKSTHKENPSFVKHIMLKKKCLAEKNKQKYEIQKNNKQSLSTQNLTKALSFRNNETKDIELQQKFLAAKNESKYKMQKDNKQNVNKHKQTKEFEAKNYISYEKHCAHNVNNVKRAQAFDYLANKTKAFKANEEKSVSRVKRSFLVPIRKREVMDNKQTKPFLDRHETVDKSSDLKPYITPYPLPLKRFNPCQTINLIMYQKLRNVKALKLKKHQRISNQTTQRLNNLRPRRALSSQTYATNSCGQQNVILKVATTIMNKAKELRKNIGNFFSESFKYLTFQKENSKNSNNSKAFTTETSVFNGSDETLTLLRHTNGGNLKLLSKNFKSEQAAKRILKTKNPKLRFFKSFLQHFYNSEQYLRTLEGRITTGLAKSRVTRGAQTLVNMQEKMPQNTNCAYSFQGHVKSLFNIDFTKKSFKDSLKKIGFFKSIFDKSKSSKKRVLPMQQEATSNTKIDFLNLTKKLTNKQKQPRKLSNTSNSSDLKKDESYNDQNKLKDKYSQSLSFNESFNTKELQEQFHKNGNCSSKLRRELLPDLQPNQTFADKTTATKAVQNLREILVGHMKSSKKAQNAFKTPKRLKRSLEPTLHKQKRSYNFHYEDLYKPDNKVDTAMQLPSKLDINIDNAPKLLTDEVLPVKQKIDFENYYKAFDNKKFDDFKIYTPQSNKFDGLQFDSIWSETAHTNENVKQQKRFLNNPDNKSSKVKSQNLRIPFKKNSAIESLKTQPKSTKLPLKVQILKDKYLKDLQNFNKNYKFIGNSFSWPNNSNNNNSMDYSEKLGLELHNEILNCKAFASLEDFIKSLPKNLSQPLLSGNFTTERNEIDLSTLTATPETATTRRPWLPQSTENWSPEVEKECVSATTESAEHVTRPSEMDVERTSEFEPPNEDIETTSLETIEEDASTESAATTPTERGNVKLNININAQVHGNPKDQRYCGNGSFSVTPDLLLDDRLRRDLKLSPLEEIPKQFLRVSSRETKDQDIEDLTDFISGKFSSQAVKDILNVVQENPHLKALWPSLKPTERFEAPNQQNFYAIRTQQNEPELRNSEQLFAQAMSAISAIVEQQARSRLCVPLRPDLQAFYDMIINMRQQQDMVREKRQNSKSSNKPDFNDELHLIDANKIEEKTKIVKKLLKQYDELPKEDQQQVAVVRDDLLKNLIVLRQLQDHEERQGNESRERRENDWAAGDVEVLKNLQGKYSLQFLKLLKAAELYREIKTD